MSDVLDVEFRGTQRGQVTIRQNSAYNALRKQAPLLAQPWMLDGALQYADEVDTHMGNLKDARKGFAGLLLARMFTLGASRREARINFDAHILERTSQHNMLLMALEDENYNKGIAFASMKHIQGWKDLPRMLEEDAEPLLAARMETATETLSRSKLWHLVKARTFIKPKYS